MTPILLASADEGFERRVRHALGGATEAQLQRLEDESLLLNPSEALRQLMANLGTAPDLLILGPDVPLEAALKVAQRFDEEHPEVNVILVARPAAKLWEKAMRAGIRDVLAPDAQDAELREALARAVLAAERRRANLAVEETDATRASRVVTIVSPKGGSGKTTLATNLAVGLAAVAPSAVTMVDFDMQFGDAASALQLMPEYSLADAAAQSSSLDPTGLKAFLVPHPSGLYALCAPNSPVEGERVTVEQATRILRLLRDEFRYIVVDTSAGLSEHTLAALELSTDVIFLCSMDVPSIRGLRKEIDALDQLGMTKARRHFVLNRADARVGLDPNDVAATIGMPIDAAIPSSRAVPLSTNQGSPLLESDPRSPVSRQIRVLIDAFVDTPTASAPAPAQPPSRSLFRRRGNR